MLRVGIRNRQEQEKRATSCLLAVMRGVPEFAYALLEELDAPRSAVIETFAEVRLEDANGKTVIPDGVMLCRRGKKAWTCLVEVKTGSTRLKDDQVNACSISRRPTASMPRSAWIHRSAGW
jgi:hypothetical protein